ncbi:MAG: hypothetical protein ABSC00_10775 [Acidimicrobiales bacterium]
MPAGDPARLAATATGRLVLEVEVDVGRPVLAVDTGRLVLEVEVDVGRPVLAVDTDPTPRATEQPSRRERR